MEVKQAVKSSVFFSQFQPFFMTINAVGSILLSLTKGKAAVFTAYSNKAKKTVIAGYLQQPYSMISFWGLI